jgi:hypothetical protein
VDVPGYVFRGKNARGGGLVNIRAEG